MGMHMISIDILPLAFVISLALLLGLIIGSFLSVVIIRLPNNLFFSQNDFVKSLFKNDKDGEITKAINQRIDIALPYNDSIALFSAKRSVCRDCQKQLLWFDNIPVVSYLLNKGRCRFCQKCISSIYIVIELITAFLFMAVALVCYWQQLSLWVLLSFWLFTSALIALTFIDAKHKILPDEITLPFVWLGLLLNIFSTYSSLELSVIGAILGYLSLWILFQVHYFFTKREGLGFGDFKLTAMIGAWLGAYSLSYVMLIASFLGLLFYLTATLLNKYHNANLSLDKEIPFGPFLSIAGFLIGLYTLSNLTPL